MDDDAAGQERNPLPVTNLRESENWREPIDAPFDQVASLEIAKWIIRIFAGAYFAAFVVLAIAAWKTDATFEKVITFNKDMLQLIIPLVTLAVGYYLGDRAASSRSD